MESLGLYPYWKTRINWKILEVGAAAIATILHLGSSQDMGYSIIEAAQVTGSFVSLGNLVVKVLT